MDNVKQLETEKVTIKAADYMFLYWDMDSKCWFTIVCYNRVSRGDAISDFWDNYGHNAHADRVEVKKLERFE